MASGLLMAGGLVFPLTRLINVFGFRAWMLQQLILHSNSTGENLYETKIFTRNNSSILKNHLKIPFVSFCVNCFTAKYRIIK